MPSDRIAARIAHKTGARVRLVAPELIDDPDKQRELEKALAAVPGLSHAEVRPSTGSVILACETDVDDLLSAVSPLLDVKETSPVLEPAERPLEQARTLVGSLDTTLLKSSGGRLGLADAAFVGLCVGAVVQMARGRFAASASALLWSAVSLAAASAGASQSGFPPPSAD